MRKLFWGLTAVAVVAAGGMFWLKWQGAALPYSIAAQAANSDNGGFITSTIAGTAAVLSGGSDTAAANGDEDLTHFQKPDDPKEIVETKDPTIDPANTAVVEFHPKPVVPTITIHEPIEVSKPIGVADSGSWASDFTVGAAAKVDPAITQINMTAIGLAHGDLPKVPRVMPYAVDDDDETPIARMKYAVEDFVPKTQDDAELPTFWSRFFGSADGQMCGDGAGIPDAADYHAHDSYCPYSGRCLPAPKQYVEPIKQKPAPASDENPEVLPPPKKSTSLKPPTVPGVDTLEFRPSDHSTYERNSKAI